MLSRHTTLIFSTSFRRHNGNSENDRQIAFDAFSLAEHHWLIDYDRTLYDIKNKEVFSFLLKNHFKESTSLNFMFLKNN